jgi:hypothetical protein
MLQGKTCSGRIRRCRHSYGEFVCQLLAIKLRGTTGHVAVDAEDAALKIKAQRPEALIMHVRGHRSPYSLSTPLFRSRFRTGGMVLFIPLVRRGRTPTGTRLCDSARALIVWLDNSR